MKLLVALTIILCGVGCASRADKLNREYDLVSRQMEGLQNEQKAVTKLELAAKEYLRIKQEYEQNKSEWQQLRERNRLADLPVGPEFDDNIELSQEITALQKNHDAISDQLRELEQQRSKIVTQQTDLIKP